jgi:hypothetical protein
MGYNEPSQQFQIDPECRGLIEDQDYVSHWPPSCIVHMSNLQSCLIIHQTVVYLQQTNQIVQNSH